jgi:hypothetical protein
VSQWPQNKYDAENCPKKHFFFFFVLLLFQSADSSNILTPPSFAEKHSKKTFRFSKRIALFSWQFQRRLLHLSTWKSKIWKDDALAG